METQQELIQSFTAIEPENTILEILPGMTIEEMKATYFDSDSLIEPTYKLWQLNSNGHRYYYRYDEKGNPEFFPSVTTILSQTLPKSKYLIKWIAETGTEEAERYMHERGMYGTFMHAEYEELLINRKYDLDGLKSKLKKYIETNRLPDDFIYYADELKKDILSFAQFIKDYDVRPLAVEIALVHPYHIYAGMIDCPCSMLSKIGCEKRINAIIDFKSGKKGFYEEAEIQLAMYRDMWNVNFEEHPIDRVYNFAPKNWGKKPTYHLKDQTDSPNAKKVQALLDIAAIEDGKKENIFTSISGSIFLDIQTDFTENIVSLTLSEIVKSKSKKNDAPGEDVKITAEDVKKDSSEDSKTKKAKRTANKASNKPNKRVSPSKRPKTPRKEESSLKEPKTTNTDMLD